VRRSADSDLAAHGLNQLARVVANSLFEDQFHVLDVSDVGGWLALDQDEVGFLARRYGPNVARLAEL